MTELHERMALAKKHYEASTGKKFTNTALAQFCGVSKVTVGLWMNGTSKTLDSKNLSKASAFFDVNPLWLAGDEQSSMLDLPIDPSKIPNYTEVDDWDSHTPVDDDEVPIVFYKDFHLQCGDGLENLVESHERRRLRMSKSTLKRLSIEHTLAFAATAQDGSMSPTICNGDTVFVDSGRKNIKDGKTFAVEHGGLFRIKRLYKMPNGGVRIVSDNHLEYPEEILTAQDIIEQQFIILGWVFSIQRLESW